MDESPRALMLSCPLLRALASTFSLTPVSMPPLPPIMVVCFGLLAFGQLPFFVVCYFEFPAALGKWSKRAILRSGVYGLHTDQPLVRTHAAQALVSTHSNNWRKRTHHKTPPHAPRFFPRLSDTTPLSPILLHTPTKQLHHQQQKQQHPFIMVCLCLCVLVCCLRIGSSSISFEEKRNRTCTCACACDFLHLLVPRLVLTHTLTHTLASHNTE